MLTMRLRHVCGYRCRSLVPAGRRRYDGDGGERARKGHPVRGVAGPGPFGDRGRHAAVRRSGRTLRMTHAGSAFKRHVDAMLFQLDDGLAAVNQLIEPETGTASLAF